MAGLLAVAYRSLEAGDADELASVLTRDATVFSLGPADAWTSQEEVATRLGQQLLPLSLGGQKLSVVGSRPSVGLADGGQSGWVSDLPQVTLVGPSGTTQWLPRVTAHVVRDGSAWRFDAVHVSLGVADELVYSADASWKLLSPTDLPPERGPGSDELVGLTRRVLDDFGVKVQHLSDRAEFIEIGTSPSETFEGGRAFRALVTPRLPVISKAGYHWKLVGGLRTRVAPDGLTGWAAGNVVMRVGDGPKAQVLPAFRALWIFVDERGGWNVAAEHQSLGVREDLRVPVARPHLPKAPIEAW